MAQREAIWRPGRVQHRPRQPRGERDDRESARGMRRRTTPNSHKHWYIKGGQVMKNKMYVTNGRGNLDLTARPIPELKSHDVLVKIAAVSINFRDIPFIKGNATRQPSLGRIPFSDAVGRVEAIGDGVERVRVGDRVSHSIRSYWIAWRLTPQGLINSFGSVGRDGLKAEFSVV